MNKPGASKEDDEDDDCIIFEDSSFFSNFNESIVQHRSTSGSFPSSKNKALNSSNTLNISALCCDEDLNGYDKLTGKTWIYPTNYPVRDYQFNIIKASIVKNTLVSLPTGLGKTFIAAVIMYNFYRWYPTCKIVFTAPTRPLVAQQIEACYNIAAIPPETTIEMTGHMQVATRKNNWMSKRVFFATPQVIYNDLQSGICPANQIRCLVFDEAHRAKGNYAYCQIVSTLTDMGCKTFRVLALSATPGSRVEDVVNVVKNLRIAHLELRTESCIDVARYSHSRQINTVIIQLGDQLTRLRQQYVEIVDNYARRLKQLNILPTNIGNLSKGRIVMLYKEYQTKDKRARHPQHNMIMRDFVALISLYHGLELLIKHGARVFLNFFDEHPEKGWMQADDKLTALLELLRDDLGINPMELNLSILPDGTLPQIPQNICFGHPKFDKLKEIMVKHFQDAVKIGQVTKAIVFCEYRESVNLVHCLLLQCQPLIKPQTFVGQGASGREGKTVVSQKQQLRVMRSFREGGCNALVATCVAEEGLDVGSVDLIVCFDVSTRSPVRLVQRCGRTGRERGGKVYILVTEGREHQTLIDCMRQRDNLNKKVLQSKDIEANLYKLNPRLIPANFFPECQKMFITTKLDKSNGAGKKPTKKGKKKGQKDIITMMSPTTASNKSNKNNFLSKPGEENLCHNPSGCNSTTEHPNDCSEPNEEKIKKTARTEKNEAKINFMSVLEYLKTWNESDEAVPSKDTEILASVLQLAVTKKRITEMNPELLTFENNEILSPIKVKSAPVKGKKKQKSPLKKDGDIRALFSTATKSTKNYTKAIKELSLEDEKNTPVNLIDLLIDLNIDKDTEPKCFTCENLFDCNIVKKLHQEPDFFPDETTLEKMFFSLLNIDSINDVDQPHLLNESNIFRDTVEFNTDLNVSDNKQDTNLNTTEVINKTNFDLEYEFEDETPDESKESCLIAKKDDNFNIGNVDDIFIDSSPEEKLISQENLIKNKNDSNPKDTLDFFGLDSIEDIFAETDEVVEIKEDSQEHKVTKKINLSPCKSTDKDSMNRSPSLLSGYKCHRTLSNSPIIGSQRKGLCVNKLISNSTPICDVIPTKSETLRPKSLFSNINNSEQVIDLADSVEWDMLFEEDEKDLNKSLFSLSQCLEVLNDPVKSKELLDISLKNNSNAHINQDVEVEESVEFNQITDVLPSPVINTNENCHINDSNDSDHESLNSSFEDKLLSPNFVRTGIENNNDYFKELRSPKKTKQAGGEYVNLCKRQRAIDYFISPSILTGQWNLAINDNILSASKENDTSNSEKITSPILLTQKEKSSIKTRKTFSTNDSINTIANNTSPILPLQTRGKFKLDATTRGFSSQNKSKESIILIDSDSNSGDTVIYDLTVDSNTFNTSNEAIESSAVKRKLEFFEDDCSPFFKKPKKGTKNIKNNSSLPIGLKSFINSQKVNNHDQKTTNIFSVNRMSSKHKNSLIDNVYPNRLFGDDNVQIHKNSLFGNISPSRRESKFTLQKENKQPKNDTATLEKPLNIPPFTSPALLDKPQSPDLDDFNLGESTPPPKRAQKLGTSSLQKFRRDRKSNAFLSQRHKIKIDEKLNARKITATDDEGNDSDSDFITNHNSELKTKAIQDPQAARNISPYHKVRKKRKRKCDFLESQAELSMVASDSGDELSDDSIGSIVDFICDEQVADDAHMRAIYMKSVKSPNKGTFKLPSLPFRFLDAPAAANDNGDNYELDSFCVDNNMGLTQAQDVSELELAEQLLETKMRRKKKPKFDFKSYFKKGKVNSVHDRSSPTTVATNIKPCSSHNESPLVIRKKSKVNRRISSGSSDSTDDDFVK